MAISESPPPGKGDDSKEPAYLVLDTESVPDGRLLRLVKYAGETLTDAEAIDKAQAEARDKTGSDFLPVSFQYPVAACILRVGANFRIQSITCLGAPDYQP